MHLRGKLVILLMFALALGLSAYAWWHQYNENPHSKRFWGPQTVRVIRRAPKIEFFDLEKDSQQNSDRTSNDPIFAIDGASYRAISREITDSPGLIHARHALTDDGSFARYNIPLTNSDWDCGVRFQHESERVTIVFDTQCERIYWLEGQKQAELVPLSAQAFRKKRADWAK